MGGTSSKLEYTPYDIVLDIQSLDDGKTGWPIYVKDPERVAEISQLLEHRSCVSYVPETTQPSSIRRQASIEPLTTVASSPPVSTSSSPVSASLESVSDPKIEESLKTILNLDNSRTVVSVIGAYNKGKTFLLNLLADTNFPSDLKVHTTGLSFMCPPRGSPMGDCLLVDNAGTNAPISQVSIERIAQKKATEQFLQEIVFLLSDVIVIVVGDLTWQDEQLIYACTQLVQRARLAGNEMRLIVVHNFIGAHTEHELLTLWRQSVMRSYHRSDAGIRSRRFTAARPRSSRASSSVLGGGGGLVHMAGVAADDDYYYDDDGETAPAAVRYYVTDESVYHTFLAKDDSPAGRKYNHLTAALIRQLVVDMRVVKEQCFIDHLLCKVREAADNFCVRIDHCSLVLRRMTTDEAAAAAAAAATSTSTSTAAQSQSTVPVVTSLEPCDELWDTFVPTDDERRAWDSRGSSPVTVVLHGDIALKRGRVAIDGSTLILVEAASNNSNPGSFLPPVDVFEDDTGVTVTLDLPGIDPESDDSDYTYSIDARLVEHERGRNLVITGERHLYRYRYQPDPTEPSGWAVCGIEKYQPPDRRAPPARERLAGSFERVVSLDKVYQCPSITMVHASNGVAQVFLAKVRQQKKLSTGRITIKTQPPAAE